MASPDLHYFKDDLTKKPTGNSGAPPRGISAKDLDENFKKVCVIKDPDRSDEPYKVYYTEDGITLHIFPNIPQSGVYVLGVSDGSLVWIPTQDCDAPAA